MKRIGILGVLVAVAVMAAAVSAQGKAVTETVTEHDLVVIIDDAENPCRPAMGEALINLMDHFTLAANGSAHGTHTETGDFFVLVDGGAVSAEGHYTFWGGFNENPKHAGGWFTLRINATSTSDGSPFSINLMGQDRFGAKSFSFIQFNCHDGNGPVRIDF